MSEQQSYHSALQRIRQKTLTPAARSNISVLIAEQYNETVPFISTDKKTGERVIVDPASTVSRIFHYFYLMINIGSLTGQISMVYAEKYVGFYLSFLLPTIMFCICPLVLFLCRNMYTLYPPQGSIYGKALKVWGLAMKGRWSINPAKTYAFPHLPILRVLVIARSLLYGRQKLTYLPPETVTATSVIRICGILPSPATTPTPLVG